ncbi:MAG: FAD binding domain-containing protein [Treponema sp.]|jgi:CO/xanthine dehydrogenase FAD-binding subunit|nr:FAD binding domain-containing protein [Treponema sp.]
MDAALNQIFFPQTYQELFSRWAKHPDAVPYAGGTMLFSLQGSRTPALPRKLISLDKLAELRRISRTERYLEVGAMVKLSDIIYLGKIVPEALTRCLEGIANPQVRNLATIGGNICFKDRRMDGSAPMIALDALYELRSAQSSRWVSASRFSSLPGPINLGPQELLSRIRIPLEQWNYTICKKYPAAGTNNSGGFMVFILKNQKDTLTDLRIVFTGSLILRDKKSESILVGRRLPLERKDIHTFMDHWRIYLSAIHSMDDLLLEKVNNFVKTSLLALADG